jgi:hypothetical protein
MDFVMSFTTRDTPGSVFHDVSYTRWEILDSQFCELPKMRSWIAGFVILVTRKEILDGQFSDVSYQKDGLG